MYYSILTCLLSVALAVSYKRENLKCHLQPGDSVEMTGQFTALGKKAGMALALRSANTIPFRVEVFPGLKAYILRSKTPNQWPPKLVRQGPYSGAKRLKIRVLVGPAKNYQVWINDVQAGMVPFIGGPAPTYIETNHDIDTETIQVFSKCAVNPATKRPATAASKASKTSPTGATKATTASTVTITTTVSTNGTKT